MAMHRKERLFWLCQPSNRQIYRSYNCDKLHSATFQHEAWELMTVRKHPEGGYELLMPHWWHTLKKVCVVEGSNDVVLRQHITTLWQFVKVD